MSHINLPMKCACGEEAVERDAELDGRTVRELIHTLNDYTIEIVVDQWMGVKVRHWSKEDSVYVECDRLEDGLAAIVDHLGLSV